MIQSSASGIRGQHADIARGCLIGAGMPSRLDASLVIVTQLYPAIEPYDHGMLEVGDGNGSTGRRAEIRAVRRRSSCMAAPVPDARPGIAGCSTQLPGASCCSISAIADGARRTPAHRIPTCRATTLGTSSPTSSGCASISRIDRWLVLGGSWGSTLALAYAERYPHRVSEIILFGVTTGRRKEFDWWFRGGAAAMFPAQWERLREALPQADREGDIIEAYCRRLNRSRSRRSRDPTRSRIGLVHMGVRDARLAAHSRSGSAIYRSRILRSRSRAS